MASCKGHVSRGLQSEGPPDFYELVLLARDLLIGYGGVLALLDP